jgi:hypothetical protein
MIGADRFSGAKTNKGPFDGKIPTLVMAVTASGAQ